MKLAELKKKYAILQKKYDLPSFEKLNGEYGIESIRKYEETLLKSVRKLMLEKIVNFMSLLELLLNPMNAPRLYLAYIKSMTNDDKKEIEKIYGKLADITLESMPLELEYSEESEAKMIKKIDKIMDEIKPDFKKLLDKMQKPLINNREKEKSYFG